MINLMFIENISRLDLIKFNSENERENYFLSKSLVTIDSIYPPHFKNRIQFSIEDLSPSTKVNYLSLYYENKYYYYFIDDINYINEGVYELTITMDTITTFMFEITINEGILERQCIKRWNDDGSINRNYIRENLSNGDFINNIYINLNEERCKCFIFKARNEILKSNSEFINDTSCYLQNLINNEYVRIEDGTLYIIIPIIEDEKWDFINLSTYFINTYNNTRLDFNYRISVVEYYHLISYLVESPYVVDAYICDNNFTNNILKFDKITYENATQGDSVYKIINYKLGSGLNEGATLSDPLELNLTLVTNLDYVYPILGRIYCKNFIIDTPSDYIRFGKNNKNNFPFSTYYIPQLLDDNYYRLYFGEKLGYITYPLYTLDNLVFYLKYNFDIISGNRNMCIFKNNVDNYLTTSINQTKESLQLFSDRFQNYMATNTGTLTTGVALARQNVQWSSLKRAWNTIQENNRGQALYTIDGGLNKNKLTSSIGNIVMDIGDTFMQYYNINQQLKIARENAEYSPDITKQGNAFSTDLISNSLNFFIKIDKVNDLEYVAHKYEQYGYLINKEIHNNYKLNDSIFNIRYYYNIVKFSDVNIVLDYLGTNTLIQNIKERLQNGLRLWNLHNDNDFIDFNNFKFDNVENEFIE